MSPTLAIDGARTLLAQHRLKERMTPLSGALAPADLEAAYAVQDALIEERLLAGRMVGGWKVALTTPVMQQFVGIDHPCAGAIDREWIYRSPAVLSAGDYVNLGVESEIAVRIGEDMRAEAGSYDRASVADSVAACMPAIEIVDDRFWDYDSADVRDLVADNALNFGCVLGPETTDWRGLDLGSITGRMRINAEVVGEGRGADVLGHPFEALAWLANHLVERGRWLREDDVVLLGSIVSTRWLEAGECMATEIDGLGRAELEVRG